MAYASKGEQRIDGSTNYGGSASTLTSDTYSEENRMGKAPDKIWSKQGGGKAASITGKTGTRTGDSKLTGKLEGTSFRGGKKGK
jgi:hypothetical protein